EVVVGAGVTTHRFIVPPGPDEEAICHNIKIRNPAYASLSLAALLFVVLAGGVIIAVNWFLPSLVFRIRRRRAGDKPDGNPAAVKTQAWIGNHLFQLHRAALESHNIGPWEPTTNEAPVLKVYGERFVLVDITRK